MLNEKEFYGYVQEHILEYVREPAGKVVKVQRICKNNQVFMAGMSIGDGKESLQPVLYLEPYYQQYKDGNRFSEILARISADYEECSLGFALEEERIKDYDFIRDKLFFRLVHFDKNREILEFCPYDRIEDLAVTYRWIAYRNEDGMASAMIRRKDLEMWGVSEEQIKQDARANTEKMFPSSIKKIENVIPIEIETGNLPIFVLSNGDYMNGASAMVYDKVLYDFASTMGENLYILPSSIHEVILLLERDAGDIRELSYMVKETNRTVVDPEEVLSDHVYYYDRREDKIRIADDAGWTDKM